VRSHLHRGASAIAWRRQLFNAAKAAGVAVFFITGRLEDAREATAKNLHTAGYNGWT
jgi:predicted secreted acid phosphatase